MNIAKNYSEEKKKLDTEAAKKFVGEFANFLLENAAIRPFAGICDTEKPNILRVLCWTASVIESGFSFVCSKVSWSSNSITWDFACWEFKHWSVLYANGPINLNFFVTVFLFILRSFAVRRWELLEAKCSAIIKFRWRLRCLKQASNVAVEKFFLHEHRYRINFAPSHLRRKKPFLRTTVRRSDLVWIEFWTSYRQIPRASRINGTTRWTTVVVIKFCIS